MTKDPYEVLGVARDATPEAIKAAYRKHARRHHPDLNPGKPEAEERFKAASGANDLLSDPERRARFDRGEIDAQGHETPPAGGYRSHAEAPQGRRYGPQRDAETFDDFFADIFEAQRAAEATPRRGHDASYRLNVSFISAVLGATEELNLPGGGTISLKVPPGVATGTVLRLRGKGEPGRNGGPAGDAMIEIQVGEHPLYRREGMDLHMDLPVTLKEAVLGGPVPVQTPSGQVRATLPPHSDTGHRIRLRGKGVAAQGDRPAGDLYLHLRVTLGQPDAALEAFLRDWTPEHPPEPRAAMEGSP